MMLWLHLEPQIWLLHPSASAIEKIRIVFIDKPLTGFGLICDLLFAMAFAVNCNFTIVYCFRVDFLKTKWQKKTPKSCLTWRLYFDHSYYFAINQIAHFHLNQQNLLCTLPLFVLTYLFLEQKILLFARLQILL